MSLKRIVDTRFWNDDKVMELYSPEDKLFMLYLLTNPHTTQLGIYSINKKHMAFELGYSMETIDILIDRFENKYKNIWYCNETKEIAIKNYLKYSIIKGGKPVEDCITKEIKLVKNKKMINYVFSNIKDDDNINITINKIIKEYNNENDIYNDNDNDNDNDVSYHDTSNDTQNIFNYIENNFGITISGSNYEKVSSWLNEFNLEMLCYAVDICVANGKRTIKYWEGILKNWKGLNYKSLSDIKNNELKNKKEETKIETFEYDWLNE